MLGRHVRRGREPRSGPRLKEVCWPAWAGERVVRASQHAAPVRPARMPELDWGLGGNVESRLSNCEDLVNRSI